MKLRNRASDSEERWLEAMRAAVMLARRMPSSEDELLKAMSEALARLALEGVILTFTADGQLEIRSIHAAWEKHVEELVGFSLRGVQFHPHEADTYQAVLLSRKSQYHAHPQSLLAQVIPPEWQHIHSKMSNLIGEQALILAPILFEDQMMGVFHVSGAQLTESDIPIVELFAEHIAIGLDQIRTKKDMEIASEREQLGMRIAEIASDAWDLQEVFARIFDLLAKATGATAGGIALLDAGSATLKYHDLFGLPEELRGQVIPRNHVLAWKVIEEQIPLLIEDYPSHPLARSDWIEAGVRSALGVPLILGNEVIGGIGLLLMNADGAFQREDLAKVLAISHVVAWVIRNAQLMLEARRHAEEAEALRRGSIAISASLDYTTVLTEISEQAKRLLRADGSRIHLYDAEHDLIQCVIALHAHTDEVMQLELNPGEGLTGHVLQIGKPLLANRPDQDPRSLQIPGTPEEEEEVLALAPLMVRHRAMGVMTVVREGYDRPFSDADLNLLTAFASQAAVAIENAHLFSQIESQAERLEEEIEARTRELRLSESRYRALVETTLMGVYQLDCQVKIVYTNQQFADLVELPAAEILGRSIADFLVPEDREGMVEQALKCVSGKGPPTEVVEVELLSWNGRHIPAILAIGRIANQEAEAEGISGLVVDISKLKALEAALRTERDRLRVILHNVGDAVVVTDPAGVIEYVNPAWEQLNGYKAEEALGKTNKLVKSDQQSPEFYYEMWEAILSGQVWRGEVINRRKDGSTYEAALNITPVVDEERRVVNFVGVQHDISVLKELDRLRSQFVSDVSHELRTPLTNIRLYLDLLRQTEYDPRASRYVETLSRESERLSGLIEDILSLSRLESNAIPLIREPVDINRLLSALVEDRERLASNYGLELRLECEANLPLVLGDEQLLMQIFTNLLTNAFNYTPDGGRIMLSTHSQSTSAGQWVLVEIEDNGFGIAPSEQPLLFRRFFRGQSSEAARVPGTGLGLAISKEIAERHGGRITVKSDGIPGGGTTFTVWLPGVRDS